MILDNYHRFSEHAYALLKEQYADERCLNAARKVVFMPISRLFNDKFRAYMEDFASFLRKTQSYIGCLVCDYDFQKSMIQDKEIKLNKSFCGALMSQTFRFVATFNLQMLQYFNNLVVLLQCDRDDGEYLETDELVFAIDSKLQQQIEGCWDK